MSTSPALQVAKKGGSLAQLRRLGKSKQGLPHGQNATGYYAKTMAPKRPQAFGTETSMTPGISAASSKTMWNSIYNWPAVPMAKPTSAAWSSTDMPRGSMSVLAAVEQAAESLARLFDGGE